MLKLDKNSLAVFLENYYYEKQGMPTLDQLAKQLSLSKKWLVKYLFRLEKEGMLSFKYE